MENRWNRTRKQTPQKPYVYFSYTQYRKKKCDERYCSRDLQSALITTAEFDVESIIIYHFSPEICLRNEPKID